MKNKKQEENNFKDIRGVLSMTCIKAQGMITPFIDNKLNIKELEEFLDHINTCQDCREELEFYYALLTAMRQLDEDKDLSDDYGLELSQKLEKAQERIIHVKYTYYRKKAILIFTIISLAIYLSLRYAYISYENEKTVTESNFIMRKSFINYRNTALEKRLENYLREQELNQTLLPTDE
jgi:hypothetical protein